MRPGIPRPLGWLALLSLALMLAAPLSAQTPAQKTPQAGRFNPNVGPASLRAGVWNDPCCQIFLMFPAVPMAEKYRVTRSDNAGASETTVFEASVGAFANAKLGHTCTALPNAPATACVFGDSKAGRSVNYTYRVWAIYAGAVVSPPSPSALSRLP